MGEVGGCALLGPEGPCRLLLCGVVGTVSRALPGVGVPAGVGFRPYFENYTVDASILDPQLFWGCGSPKWSVLRVSALERFLLTHVVVASF